MIQTSIEEWVNQNTEKPPKMFRQAVHTILLAVSQSIQLHDLMIMKGGILIALKYGGIRHTKDIDFSTELKYKKFNQDKFNLIFEQSLLKAVQRLDYGLDCKIQSTKLKPPNQPDASFPSLQINIGYAYNGTPAHRHLIVKRCTNVIPVDFSFNEITKAVESINITEKEQIQVYSLPDLIAEKYRAILQQEVRKRIRRQDVFDLYFILQNREILSGTKQDIYESLLEKSRSRNLLVNQLSMDNPNLKDRCEKEYYSIQDEIETELPDFESTYHFVNLFYKSLPWK